MKKKGKISRREFARRFSKAYGFSYEIGAELVRDVFTELGNVIAEGNGVVIDNFGSFVLTDQQARDIKNPTYGVIHTEPTKLLKFSPSFDLRLRVREIPVGDNTAE